MRTYVYSYLCIRDVLNSLRSFSTFIIVIKSSGDNGDECDGNDDGYDYDFFALNSLVVAFYTSM